MRLLSLVFLLVVSCRVFAYESIVNYYDSDSSASAACDAFLVAVSSTGYCYGTSTGYRTFYSGDYYSFDVVEGCEGYAYTDVDGQCTDEEPDYCADSDLVGAVWDADSESCVCPDGQSDFLGTDGSYTCKTVMPECTEDSDAFTGSYLNDTPICDYNDFCDDGESGGLVGTDWVCVPDVCDGGTYINGSCIFPDDTSTQPSENFGDSDSDGDGVGDTNDGDLDGDGIPNSEDDDMDGDGVSNFDDPSPFDPDGDSGSATAQGGCDVPPTCFGGDAQLCAILKQQWYSMCYEDDEDSYSGDGFYDPDSSEGSESRIGALFTDFKERVVASDMVVAVSDFFDYGGGGACPVYSVDAWVFSITLDQWCSDKIPWDLISGMLFAVALLIGGRIVVS